MIYLLGCFGWTFLIPRIAVTVIVLSIAYALHPLLFALVVLLTIQHWMTYIGRVVLIAQAIDIGED